MTAVPGHIQSEAPAPPVPPQKPGSPARLLQLDFVRGVAILLVIGNHFVVPPEEAGALRQAAGFLHRFGWTGVDLFFVLSGFLVGGLLFKELRQHGRLDVRRFILRRGFKIWPGYYVFLAVMLLLELMRGSGIPGALRAIGPNLLHVQNYFPGGGGHTWSLAVEEHFYLALPLLLLALIRRGGHYKLRQAMPRIVIGIAAGCLASRCLNLAIPYADETHFFPTHLRFDSLFIGVLLGYCYYFEPEWLAQLAKRPRLPLLGLAAVLPAAWFHWTHPLVWTVGFTLLALGCACILVKIVHTPLGEGRLGKALAGPLSRAVAWIGFFSYSIYLWHDMARIPVKHLRKLLLLDALPPELRWLTVNLAFLAGALIIGVVMARIVELPALWLRDRFFPGRVSTGLERPTVPDSGPETRDPGLEVAGEPKSAGYR